MRGEGTLLQFIFILFQAGSKPWPPQGWQREMRLAARQVPRNGPYLLMASMAYWEQEGM